MHFCHKICIRNHLEFGEFLCATSDVGTSATVEDMINSHTNVGGTVGNLHHRATHLIRRQFLAQFLRQFCNIKHLTCALQLHNYLKIDMCSWFDLFFYFLFTVAKGAAIIGIVAAWPRSRGLGFPGVALRQIPQE
jgi:hypothetical protein